MSRAIQARKKCELLPDFSCFIDEIEKNGISAQLLHKIIKRHKPNAMYNKKLWERYLAIDGGVPIFSRRPIYDEERPINNRINNDFFGEIVNFKTGYFAGVPFAYGYSHTEEAETVTGGEQAVDEATKAITDFVTRNNMYSVDMETTKNAAVYGYSGRLFYIDYEGFERVIPVPGYETIILSKTGISEPQYAIRYREVIDVNNSRSWVVEFYDDIYFYTYKGSLSDLKFIQEQEHGYTYCPLQGIANNKECIGDAEKVLELIDAYDRTLSDNSNDIEAFANAYMIFEGVGKISETTIQKGQKSGSFIMPTGKVYYLTKDINDTFTENHLERIEDNIYRFSQTPNLGDETFGAASGVSLKFKLHGLETKCSAFQANFMNATVYMWKLLAGVWGEKEIKVDPLQCTIEFKRNFPQDSLSNAQTAQALIAAGIPKRLAWQIAISEIDDIEYALQLAEQEMKEVGELYPDL